MATPVAPQPIDADNFAGSSPTRRTVCCNDWHRVGRFHVGTSYNSQSSLQMPDIRLQALPFAINSEFVLTLGGSPYRRLGGGWGARKDTLRSPSPPPALPL